MSAPKRKQLSDAEVGVIKGLFVHYPGRFTNQSILSKFSVPARTVNAGRISEIKKGHARYKGIPPASKEKVDQFLEGKVKLHELAGELFALAGAPQTVLGVVEYDSVTLEVNTPESGLIEYKEIHEASSIPVYLKILASMANAGYEKGGIIFGVSDDPPKIVGDAPHLFAPSLTRKWHDIAREHFEPFFNVRFKADNVGQKHVAIAQLVAVPSSVIICRKASTVPEKGRNISGKGGNKSVLKEGAVYYRYADSTREIRYSELRVLIDRLAKSGG